MADERERQGTCDDESEGEEEDEDLCVAVDGTGRIFGVEYDGQTAVYERAVDAAAVDLLRRDSVKIVAVDRLTTASTHWISADEQPRFTVEALALAVFDRHWRRGAFEYSTEDSQAAGVEFWFQTRTLSDADELGEDGGSCILAHFDKDERAKEQYGVTVHPQLSTVTYLSDRGAPTLVTPLTIADAVEGPGRAEDGATLECELVEPAVGRHLVFDGRKLHAAFPSLRRTSGATADGGDSVSTRVTFLANIWVGHRPLGIRRLPASVARAAGLSPCTARAAAGLELREGDRARIAEIRPAGGTAPTEHTLPFSGGVGALRCSLPAVPPAMGNLPSAAFRFVGLRPSSMRIVSS